MMVKYFKDKEYEKVVEDAQVFGFTPKNEINNGRWVREAKSRSKSRACIIRAMSDNYVFFYVCIERWFVCGD